jgi:hypothetical protein
MTKELTWRALLLIIYHTDQYIKSAQQSSGPDWHKFSGKCVVLPLKLLVTFHWHYYQKPFAAGLPVA